MEVSTGAVRKLRLFVFTAFFLFSLTVSGQGLSDNVTSISGSGSLFSALTHTRTDLGSRTASNTEPSLGLAGRLGGNLESGANALALQYGGTLETSRDLPEGDQTDNSSVSGASRYTYFDPGSHFDFNLGHTVSSVRNDTGFVINPSSYDTRNTLSAGAGLRFYPGALSTVRVSGQAGKSYSSGDLNDTESLTASTEISRRLSERSTGSLVGSRSWSSEDNIDITIDTAQLVYDLSLETGTFRVGGGLSQSETDFAVGTTSESEAVTGFLERSWVSRESRTSVEYNRRLSDSTTDLSLDIPPIFDFLPDTVRIRDLVVSDSLLVSHNTSKLCAACSLSLAAEAVLLESQVTGETTHEFRTNVNLGLQLTTLQRLNFGYSWQGEAEENTATIFEQIHRFNTSWTRQLAEDTSFSVQFNQSYLRSRRPESNDQDRFVLKFLLTRGFSLMAQR